jgi:hypothetical protein
VLITGASSGIGRDLALDLAADGAYVILVARRTELLNALQQQIEKSGGKADVRACDLADQDARRGLIAQILTEEKPIDILINNAGFGWYGFYQDMPEDVLENLVEVNINAMLALTRALLPHMQARKQGQILNIGSIAGGFPNQGVAVYSATKAFMDAFTTALQRELRGSGVEASVVRLGPVKTEFFDTARGMENGRRVPGETFAIPVDRAIRAIKRVIVHPRRVAYIPSYMRCTRSIESLFGGLIDRLGPLLLKRRAD